MTNFEGQRRQPRPRFLYAALLTLLALGAALQPAAAQTITVAAAGDIACSPDSDPHFDDLNGDPSHCRMLATSNLIEDAIAHRGVQAVLALGDIQYSTGRLAAYQDSFDKTWGRFKDIIYPVPGNHDYRTDGAAGYYRYFGARAGDPAKGYYSFDLGAWHVVALNSNCDDVGGCDAGSEQGKWLEADLKAHPAACVLAYWHHPRFSSGYHGPNATHQDVWEILDRAGADVVLAGHGHDYERFAPQSPDGRSASAKGIRAFVVGTGGVQLKPIKDRQPNSEVFLSEFGVLFLALEPEGYQWTFQGISGEVLDSGEDHCRQPVQQ